MATLEELFQNHEQELIQLLERKPELYHPLSIPSFPIRIEQKYSPEGNEQFSQTVRQGILLGLLFNQLYKMRIANMATPCAEWVHEVQGIPKEQLRFPLNKDTLFDLRDYGKIVPSFDDPDNSNYHKDLESLLPTLTRTRGVPPLNSRHHYLDVTRRLVELSYHFDELAIKEQITHRGEKRGERLDQMSCYPIYNTIIDRYNEFLQGGIGEKVSFARELLFSIREMLRLGAQQGKFEDKLTTQILDHLRYQQETLDIPTITVGVQEDWRDNLVTRIPGCCIHHCKSNTSPEIKKGKKSFTSLEYTIDPVTHQLFFSSENPKNEAQALAILFEATDREERPYLVLEGVLMNQEFRNIPLSSEDKYRRISPQLYRRDPILDHIIYHVAKLSYDLDRSLFINMNEITGMEEYGPHDLLYYLSRLFQEVSYHHQNIDLSTSGGELKRLAISATIADKIYLRKDNSTLQKILVENGIEIPPALIDSQGRLKLLSHTWADPTNPDTWINSCEGNAYGKIIPLEELRNIV